MGWFTSEYRGYKMVDHGGDIDGFSAEVSLVPSQKIGIVLLTNENESILFNEAARPSLTDWLLGLKPDGGLVGKINKNFMFDPEQYRADIAAARAYKSDPKELAKLEGDYTGVAGTVSIVLKDGMLHLVVSGPITSDIALVQYKPDAFLLNTTIGTSVTFKIDDKGTASIYQGETQIAQRPNKDVKLAEYKDPKGRFTLTIPDGVTSEQKGDVLTWKSADPEGTFLVTALDAGKDDLNTVTAAFVKQIDASSTVKLLNQRDIPINGLTWTQYIYQLPSGEILAVEAIKQGSTAYFITAQAKAEAIQNLAAKLNSMLLTFKITS